MTYFLWLGDYPYMHCDIHWKARGYMRWRAIDCTILVILGYVRGMGRFVFLFPNKCILSYIWDKYLVPGYMVLKINYFHVIRLYIIARALYPEISEETPMTWVSWFTNSNPTPSHCPSPFESISQKVIRTQITRFVENVSTNEGINHPPPKSPPPGLHPLFNSISQEILVEKKSRERERDYPSSSSAI